MIIHTIQRGSDDQDSTTDFDDLISRVDMGKHIFDPVTGKLKEKYYGSIEGDFFFKNINKGRIKEADVGFQFNNAFTEWLVGAIILNDDMGKIDTNHVKLGTFKQLIHLEQAKLPFMDNIKNVFLESITHLNSDRDVINRRIENPKTKRIIHMDKGTYKKIFGDLILNKVYYKPLNKHEQIDYEIKNNCAVDFLLLYEKFNIEQMSKILGRKINNDLTYLDIIKIYNHYKRGIVIYDRMNNILDENNYEDKRIFKICDDHLYVLDNLDEKKKHTTRVINKVEDIDKYTNNRLIVTDNELWKEIFLHIYKNYVILDFTLYEIPYKTNIIKIDKSYETDREILKKHEANERTVYSLCDKNLRLTGYLNEESYNIFLNTSKTRIQKSEKENNILLDINNAYPSQIKENIIFPIPSYNDTWEHYDEKPISQYSLYFCELNSHDDILGPWDGVFTYYETEILKNENRIKKITHVFNCSDFVKITHNDIKFIESIHKDRIRSYIGWLRKHEYLTSNRHTYDNDNDNKNTDIEAIKAYYGCEINESKIKVENKFVKILTHNQVFLKSKIGIISNILIQSLTNIQLYEMNKLMYKLNPKIKLNTITTDSLGYICDKKIKVPKNLIKKESGYWKYENKKQKDLKNHKHIKEMEPPKVRNFTITNYKYDNIDELINNDKSFIISGKYKTGKSYAIHNKIVPKLNQLNKTYLISSVTRENSSRIKGETIASLFFNQSCYQIAQRFKDIDYLIIDEVTLLKQDCAIYLDYIKTNLKTRFILIGDEEQTHGDLFKNTFNDSKFLLMLGDCNILKMLEKNVCDQKINDIIDTISKMSCPWNDILKYILSNFQTTNDINKTKIHLCRHKKTKDSINSQNGLKCKTIVESQGETINEPYMIHDLKFIRHEEMITALTRSCKWEDVYIYKE